jgi:hypothetical protein
MTDPTTTLVPIAPGSTSLTVPEAIQLGGILAKSGYFQNVRDAAQAVAKILRGQELGIGPVAAMEGIQFVQGKMSLSAGLVASLIQKSRRYSYRVVKHDNDECVLEFREQGEPVGQSTFTIKDATTAGLTNNPTWGKYRRNMLFSRALTNGARWYCPEVFQGAVYTPDELQAPARVEALAEPVPIRPPQPPTDGDFLEVEDLNADGTVAQGPDLSGTVGEATGPELPFRLCEEDQQDSKTCDAVDEKGERCGRKYTRTTDKKTGEVLEPAELIARMQARYQEVAQKHPDYALPDGTVLCLAHARQYFEVVGGIDQPVR